MPEAEYRRALAASNQDPIPRDLMLQVYLPERELGAVLRRLYREIEILAPLLARDRSVVRLAFVGQGLACLEPAQRAELLESLSRHFSLAADALSAAAADADADASSCDVLGIGPGSLSRIGCLQVRNVPDPGAYCQALDLGRLPIDPVAAHSRICA